LEALLFPAGTANTPGLIVEQNHQEVERGLRTARL